jgi:polyhydroxyalkanoate synthase subunit PhaC
VTDHDRRSSPPEEAEALAPETAEAVAADAGLGASMDPLLLAKALMRAASGVAAHPLDALVAGVNYAQDLGAVAGAAVARATGARAEGPVAPMRGDTRFGDPAWDENPAFFAAAQSYLLWSRLMRDLLDASRLDGSTGGKAAFATDLMVDVLAPSNFLLSNPAALQRAFETGGRSLVRGWTNFLYDLANNGGFPRKVDKSSFELGKDLAATPGRVVLRNELMELIQYSPQTEEVFETPLLCSPPWINKYYIMDLAPGRSFIEWAVQHGHTVFSISYRNPDESLRDVEFEDYLLRGPLDALDAITDITGAEQVNVVGLCLGGTLTGILLAYLAAKGDNRVRSATLLNTLIDFSEPGMVGCFTDPDSIAALESKMAKRGYLEASSMSRMFDLIRANDLVFRYVVNNWLMGQDPPSFDILAWNDDGTRMPARMHSFYLRSFYGKNQLARNELEIAGVPIRLDEITQDVYIVAAERDHIAPWRGSYKTTQLLEAPVCFVLTSSGHIAGIVNPPNPKPSYWADGSSSPDPDVWRTGATEHRGTWWEHWTKWIEDRAGGRRRPPPLGSASYPPAAPAPGAYVHGS